MCETRYAQEAMKHVEIGWYPCNWSSGFAGVDEAGNWHRDSYAGDYRQRYYFCRRMWAGEFRSRTWFM